MRRYKRDASFLIAYLITLFFNWEMSIPAWILLVLHFVLGWSILWFILALAAWMVIILLWMLLMQAAARCGDSKDAPRENKNPYSVRSSVAPTENHDTSS